MAKAKRKFLNVGDSILNGKYDILKVIHTKGMANVYLVEDTVLRKQWCLKEIIKSEAGRDMVEYYSLIQEACIMRGLNHPSIPRIVNFEEDGDSIFIVMDYVEGISVKEWLDKKGVINQQIAINWMKQVCGVMMYLHNRKRPIIYRDMKPDNIMVQDDGNIKILDFGISEIITDNNNKIKRNLGTLGYAAPEQKTVGNKYDLRSDIYAMGMTLYHMLTGIHPGSVRGNLKSLQEVDPSLPAGLEVIINKCTKRKPEDRYQSVEELLYDLKNFEKLDSTYIDKVKRKIKTTKRMFFLSLTIILLSFIPLGLHEFDKNGIYEDKLELAYHTGRTSDYLEVIAMKPLRLEPYEGLLDSYKIDGVFTVDEEVGLLEIVDANLKGIEKQDDFGRFAYNMGKLYWYYYDNENREDIAYKWFLSAYEMGYNEAESKLYYDIGNFNHNISMAVSESRDSGMYAEYWSNLNNAKGSVSGELLELQLYNSMAELMNTYAKNLKLDGVPKDSIDSVIQGIGDYISSADFISNKSLELLGNLKESYSTLRDNVNAAYSEGGV